MKVLVLAGGRSVQANETEQYPLLLAEFGNQPLVQVIVDKCRQIDDSTIIFALSTNDLANFQLDAVLALLGKDIKIARIEGETSGATCTALLAVDDIDQDDELLILNGNEFLDKNYQVIIEEFRRKNLDAGVVTFDSIHPRYSYVRLDQHNLVIEAAEKIPISRNATIGFYWFKQGSLFFEAAKEQIRNQQSYLDKYFVCPTLNFLVLDGKKIGTHKIEVSDFHPLKTEKQISHFESSQK